MLMSFYSTKVSFIATSAGAGSCPHCQTFHFEQNKRHIPHGHYCGQPDLCSKPGCAACIWVLWLGFIVFLGDMDWLSTLVMLQSQCSGVNRSFVSREMRTKMNVFYTFESVRGLARSLLQKMFMKKEKDTNSWARLRVAVLVIKKCPKLFMSAWVTIRASACTHISAKWREVFGMLF